MALAVWRTVPEKYAAFHAALMGARGGLTIDKLLDMAAGAGADPEAIRAGMKDPEVAAIIAQTHGLATKLGIRGTPAFVIDGTLIPGAISIDNLRDLVAASRKG